MLIILASFIVVFARAMQQQNVIGGHYLAAMLTPYLIAVGEVLTVLWVVDTGWQAIPLVGTGGALGSVSAMWLHRRIKARFVQAEAD
jgi:hypothetical protein